MSLTGANTRAIVFLRIELDGITLRYATENIITNDTDNIAYFWEGRIAPEGISNLTAGFNDFRESSAIISSVSVTLMNGKASENQDTLDSLISSYFWGNRKATLFLTDSETVFGPVISALGPWRVGARQTMGPGKHIGPSSFQGTYSDFILSDSDILFKGVIQFPNTFTRHDENRIAFNINDNRYNDQILINPNIFERGSIQTETRFPAIRESDISKTIPVIYGDFSNYPVVKSAMISFDGTIITFKAADTSKLASGQASLYSIDGLIVDGIGKPLDGPTPSLGIFTVDQRFLQIDSEVIAFVKGKTRGTSIASNFGGSASTLLEHPVEVLYDLLTLYLSVDEEEIDLDTFSDQITAQPNLKCKAYFGSPTAVVDVIQSLCFEFGLDLFRLGEKFQLSRVSFETPSTTYPITQDDIAPQTYFIEQDPNRIYFNTIGVKFDKTYDSNEYLKGLSIAMSQKKEFHGITRDNSVLTTWIYDESDVAYRFGRLLYIASLPIKTINFMGFLPAFVRTIDEWISLTYHIYTDQRMLLRSITKDVNRFAASVKLWNFGDLTIKDWAGAVSAPANIAAAQAATYAIYHAQLIIFDDFNDEIKINYNGGGDVTVTLTPDTYGTVTEFTAAITAAITAQVGSAVTLAYNTSTYRFSFSAAANFVIKWTDIPEFGRGIGFDTSTNDTGTNTYTADNVAPIDGVNQISNWN